MTNRKVKNKATLTKIDLDLLKPKPYGVSQHGTGGGKRVTTTVNPIRRPVVTSLPDSVGFDADSSNFSEECLDDDGDEASRGFYAARVSTSPASLSL